MPAAIAAVKMGGCSDTGTAMSTTIDLIVGEQFVEGRVDARDAVALRDGARAIEVDIGDADDGEPASLYAGRWAPSTISGADDRDRTPMLFAICRRQ